MTKDQFNLESLFGHLLEDFKAGELSKEQAIRGLVAFSVALNKGDFDEVRRWAEQGRNLARDLISLDRASLFLSRPVGTLPH